jgi:hypothetical protein
MSSVRCGMCSTRVYHSNPNNQGPYLQHEVIRPVLNDTPSILVEVETLHIPCDDGSVAIALMDKHELFLQLRYPV